MTTTPDVCLILEGTYPYVTGGVSSWTHEVIKEHPELSFSLVCLLPQNGKKEKKFTLPDNVIAIDNLYIQSLPNVPDNLSHKEKKQLFESIELPILLLQQRPSLEVLQKILDAFKKVGKPLGEEVLLNSPECWEMLLRTYRSLNIEGSFLNFYWSWRGLLSGLYSILLAQVPEAHLYHTICTGYAGLYAAVAKIQKKKPCILTEHGIYTNERKIEIIAASWLNNEKAMDLELRILKHEKDLKDYWIDTFIGYSKVCYAACDRILTLYEGNQILQKEEGADRSKMEIIPNGIDVEKFSIEKSPISPPYVVALVGRIVPIKDVKTFIRAMAIVRKSIPDVISWVVGPTDEDPEYYDECKELVQEYCFGDQFQFLGKVNLLEILDQIDLTVLTSISEGQPLVLLELGAAGIPFVATDIGACSEIAYGTQNEIPSLGQAGWITALANPEETAKGIRILLENPKVYSKYSETIRARVKNDYNKEKQMKAYQNIYRELLEENVWQALGSY